MATRKQDLALALLDGLRDGAMGRSQDLSGISSWEAEDTYNAGYDLGRGLVSPAEVGRQLEDRLFPEDR